MKRFILLIAIIHFEISFLYAQGVTFNQKIRLNFFISVRTKNLDPAIASAQLQARITDILNNGEMYCMFVESAKEMADRMTAVLKKRNALIGNIWFDSHGHFSKRRALFDVGKDEFNAESILDSVLTAPFKIISKYCDTNTVIGIGSCYGGATYTFPSIEGFPEQQMKGEQLMMHLSSLLNDATVYGSESFVMTGPGIFTASYNLAGYPRRKKFRDPIYKPVWDNLGEWNCYNGKTKAFYGVTTVTLNHEGGIYCKPTDYLSFEKNRHRLQQKLLKFKRGNYNIASFYQE